MQPISRSSAGAFACIACCRGSPQRQTAPRTAGITAFNIATGGQVARLADEHAGDRSQTRPYFDGLLIHTKTHLPAGRALTHGVALLSRGRVDDEAWRWAAEAAAAPAGPGLLHA